MIMMIQIVQKSEPLRSYRNITPQFQELQIVHHLYQSRVVFDYTHDRSSLSATSLQKNDVEERQSPGYADVLILIVQTAVEKSRKLTSTIVLTQDIDVLVILTALAKPENPALLLKSKMGSAQRKVFFTTALKKSTLWNEILHSLGTCI